MPIQTRFWKGVALVATLSLTAGQALAEGAAPATGAPAAEPAAEPALKPAADTKAAPVSADTVVATVNGTAITLGHMIVLREQLPEEYQSLPDDVLFRGILDQLVQQTALAQSVEDKLTHRDDLSLENDRRAYMSGAAVQAAMAVPVTDEALQAAYDAKYGATEPTKEYHAAHILVATEEKARELKARIDGGAKFAEVAMAHSTDGAAASGGDLGWFGQGMMVREFEDAVIAMTQGTVSDPIQTQFGWHLINLTETRSASAPALESVRAELEAGLRQKAVEDRIKELTAAAKVERMEAGIDPAVISDQTLLGN